jgi:creatinine amidohydrolase
MTCKKVLYEELQPGEFLERVNAFPVAYLPLGTLEWHGLHMPLGADGLQARGVFERIALEVGGILLPTLFLGPDISISKNDAVYYGMDQLSFDETCPQQLEGSAYYIEDDKFSALLDTIMENLSRAGFKVVMGHGHGPSIKAFSQRKQIFKDKFGLITYNLWELGYEGRDGIQTDHAAANETSLLMALRPDLVDIEKLSTEDTPVGIWGEDPRKAASAFRGNEIIEKNVSLVSQRLQEIVSALPKQKRSLNYGNVKSLLEEEERND